ncbi:MAG: PTS glucose transporter subunit IIA [Spiroplasma sp.]|nr:PTS glucose transporter subunit IIA [Mycoplasmatales bacterium]
MSLFSFKKKKEIEFSLPITGEIIAIEDVQDPVFAQKMMGDGFAIIPTDGNIYAPFDGVILSVFPTGHAVGIKSEDGMEVLIHFGLDTVKLKGEGFRVHVEQNDVVKAGDLLITVDIKAIQPLVPSLVSPVIFTKIDHLQFNAKLGDSVAKDKGVITFKRT